MQRLRPAVLLGVLLHLQVSALVCPMGTDTAAAGQDDSGTATHAAHHVDHPNSAAADSHAGHGSDASDDASGGVPCAAMMACGAPASPPPPSVLALALRVVPATVVLHEGPDVRFHPALDPPPPRTAS